MKTLVRLTWVGLAGFLLSIMVGLFTTTTSPDISGIAMASALASAALFFGGAFGMATHVEETPGEAASRDLHAARWLNAELLAHMQTTRELTARAHDLSQKLTATGFDCAMATRYVHDSTTLNQLRLDFAATAQSIQGGAKQAKYLLDELEAHHRKSLRLANWASQAESKIRHAHLISGGRTWIAGPPVAGQWILVGDIEPQRILVITHPVFKDSVVTIKEAASELDYARVMSPQCLERLSAYLTKIR